MRIPARIHIDSIDDWLYTGFYPRIYDQGLDPSQALSDYFATYVERDIRKIVNIRNISLFEKFVKLCAGRVGQVLNVSSLANDAGINHVTAREWLTLLEASYTVFQLPPFYRNIGKRLIKPDSHLIFLELREKNISTTIRSAAIYLKI